MALCVFFVSCRCSLVYVSLTTKTNPVTPPKLAKPRATTEVARSPLTEGRRNSSNSNPDVESGRPVVRLGTSDKLSPPRRVSDQFDASGGGAGGVGSGVEAGGEGGVGGGGGGEAEGGGGGGGGGADGTRGEEVENVDFLAAPAVFSSVSAASVLPSVEQLRARERDREQEDTGGSLQGEGKEGLRAKGGGELGKEGGEGKRDAKEGKEKGEEEKKNMRVAAAVAALELAAAAAAAAGETMGGRDADPGAASPSASFFPPLGAGAVSDRRSSTSTLPERRRRRGGGSEGTAGGSRLVRSRRVLDRLVSGGDEVRWQPAVVPFAFVLRVFSCYFLTRRIGKLLPGCCCSHMDSNSQIRGHGTISSHSGVKDYLREKLSMPKAVHVYFEVYHS